MQIAKHHEIPTIGQNANSLMPLQTISHYPAIPPTPGPSPVTSLQRTAQDRFAGLIWLQKEPNREIADYLSDYDWHEEYSESKVYSKRPYMAAYKGLLREYVYYLCVISSTENGANSERHYVVAKKIKSELEALEPFCSCLRCVASNINPLKYVWCPHCTGCIKAGAGFAKAEYIALAKQRKDEKALDENWWQRLNKIQNVTGMEIASAIVLVLAMLRVLL